MRNLQSETPAETYYRDAYEHGQQAFALGEALADCDKHYGPGPSPLFGDAGIRGWRSGWRDAYRATLQDLWVDDASYAAYQGRD